jgi:hypothetical protein
MLNGALRSAPQIDENCNDFGKRREPRYSERLTDNGVMWRGLGIARLPAAV